MTTKTSSIGQWVGAVIATVVIIGASFLGFHAFNARAHANAELQSGAQSPQSERLSAPNNLAPNRETPLNPQNRLPLTSRSPLPRHTSTQVDKLVPKRHHSGTSTCGHMRSIPETQKTS